MARHVLFKITAMMVSAAAIGASGIRTVEHGASCHRASAVGA